MATTLPLELGFTGTKEGCTALQHASLAYTVAKLVEKYQRVIANHGDCVGADAQFHALCLGSNVPVVVYPPDDEKHQAWCQGAIEYKEPAPYLTRNENIVRASKLMLACPKERIMQLRSGTWATVRKAKKLGVPVWIIFPDGTIET